MSERKVYLIIYEFEKIIARESDKIYTKSVDLPDYIRETLPLIDDRVPTFEIDLPSRAAREIHFPDYTQPKIEFDNWNIRTVTISNKNSTYLIILDSNYWM